MFDDNFYLLIVFDNITSCQRINSLSPLAIKFPFIAFIIRLTSRLLHHGTSIIITNYRIRYSNAISSQYIDNNMIELIGL